MALRDNKYSRFVQLAKITLPLIALALLSTLFLFSKSLDPSQAIPFADVDVEQIAREQRLASPRFSHVTSDGSEVTLRAVSAVPSLDDSRRLSAQQVETVIDTPKGLRYQIDAASGVYDGNDNSIILQGDVVITTSTGYRLETEELHTNAEETALNIPVELHGTGPQSDIRADRLDLELRGGAQILVFKGNVKLVYRPENRG